MVILCPKMHSPIFQYPYTDKNTTSIEFRRQDSQYNGYILCKKRETAILWLVALKELLLAIFYYHIDYSGTLI